MAKFENNNAYLIASVFGAHMNNLNRGFTHNSVIFLLNTFKNWSCPGTPKPEISETEIQLFLEDFVKNSHAKKLTRKQPYRYKLNESGLIEITRRAVSKNYVYQRSAFLFAFSYFCLLYTSPSPRDQRGSRMPSSA